MILGSFVIAWCLVMLAANLLEATSLSFWGDVEGLVVHFWIASGLLALAGVVVVVFVNRRVDHLAHRNVDHPICLIRWCAATDAG